MNPIEELLFYSFSLSEVLSGQQAHLYVLIGPNIICWCFILLVFWIIHFGCHSMAILFLKAVSVSRYSTAV